MAAARGAWLSRSKNTNREFTLEQLRLFLGSVLSSVRDLLPIVLVVAFFQVVVLQEPVPNLERILVGSLLVVLGKRLGGSWPARALAWLASEQNEEGRIGQEDHSLALHHQNR